MTSPNTLAVSRLINVGVVLTPQAAQGQNLTTLLVLGNSDVIDVVSRLRTYTDLAAIASDFGTSAPEYLAAAGAFAQSPQPAQLMIGRWAQTATKGELIGATLSAAEQAMSVWTAITSGGFHIQVDALTAVDVTGLNFSAQTNLNGVASVITAALTGAICTWNANYGRFQIESATTGVTSAISFLSAPATGTDISGMLGMTSTTSGAYVANGIAAETAAAAAALFDATFGQKWYALLMPTIAQDGTANADHLAVAAYIEAANTKHLYFVNTQEAGCLVATDTTNIMYALKSAGYNRSASQFSSSSLYAAASLAAKAININYNGSNTTITLMYKQEPGFVAENLNETQADAIAGFNGNVFVAYQNETAILQNGVMASGVFIDEMTDTDWLAVTVMTALYNLLYTSPTKIPQTDAGVHLLVTTVESVCVQGVVNGTLAPGTWQSGGFGTLSEGDFLPKGFYVYAPPVATQTQADRAARKSPPIQVAAKLAGAIHDVGVTINVNP